MKSEENIPLLVRDSHKFTSSLGYVDNSNSEKGCTQKLSSFGNRVALIVATCAVVIFVILMLGVVHVSKTENDKTDESIKNEGKLMQVLDNSSPRKSKILSTPLGDIKGYVKRSRKGREYVAFYKVPYAKPPLGDLRFKLPEPVEKWKGIRDVQDVAPACIQKYKPTLDLIIGEEDCLYTNIYVPNTAKDLSTLNLPVMVNIHNSGFAYGNGSKSGADYFMDEDVILITFQSRLGHLGFLSTSDKVISGNMGFKDQVMLLKWVQKFIKYFGGNENLVTVFGNSSGGFSAEFLITSPMATGLFQRAISQSGSALVEPGTLVDLNPAITRNIVADHFNCSKKDSKDFLRCMQAKDVRDIVSLRDPEIMFALTIEEGTDSDVFMPDHPLKLARAGKVNQVPYIVGITSTENIATALGILEDPKETKAINEDFKYYLNDSLGLDISNEESEKLRRFYFGDKPIGLETERNLTNLISDRTFAHGMKMTAELHSKVSDTYLYTLKKRPRKSYAAKYMAKFPDLDLDGVVSHADEVQFFFHYNGYPYIPTTDNEYFPFSEFLVKLWSYFGKTGKVDVNDETRRWERVDSKKSAPQWFELNDQSKPTDVLEDRLNYWDRFTIEELGYTKRLDWIRLN